MISRELILSLTKTQQCWLYSIFSNTNYFSPQALAHMLLQHETLPSLHSPSPSPNFSLLTHPSALAPRPPPPRSLSWPPYKNRSVCALVFYLLHSCFLHTIYIVYSYIFLFTAFVIYVFVSPPYHKPHKGKEHPPPSITLRT